jgi:hypothetical protein
MCGVVFEIGLIIFGILVLARGRFKLSTSKIVSGGPAYFIGILLLMTLPVLFIALVAMVLILALQGHDPEQLNLDEPALVLLFFVSLGLLLPSLIVALVWGRSEQEERLRQRALDDFDDQSPGARRRRRFDEDDYP